jgi:hypothetical protein
MIRPVQFSFNEETAVNNSFQIKGELGVTQNNALQEFDLMVELLRKNKINVLVVEDTVDPVTPDSIFPNNWISFHENGSLITYPMFAENRRNERKQHVIDRVSEHFKIGQFIDITQYEQTGQFLEGTGSMVLDREHKIAYACLSSRTHLPLLEEWCKRMDYTQVSFISVDDQGDPIYHTNVMMCIADRYAAVCLDSVINELEKEKLKSSIILSGKELITITREQMNQFAGNMLQVHNNEGEVFLVMSSQAYSSLTTEQINKLETYNQILHSDISTIEQNGGGSARCMMAEIFLSEN